MAEKTKSSLAAVQYFTYIIKVMRENEEFLWKNAKETCDEVIELINDAIDDIGLAVKRAESRKDYIECSIAFFTYHILMPFSYGIYTDLLSGNLPVCFMELRLMLESIVKCYLADTRYAEEAFFQEKLKLLEQEIGQGKLSTSKLMKDMGKKLGVENDFIALWGKLSQDWVHTKGIADKVVGYLIERSDVPPWALAIPINYTKNDLSTIKELCNRISQFRGLLTTTMEKYRQEHSFDV